MKTFLKILLTANFLLQISMANEESDLEEDKTEEGTAYTKQKQGTAEHYQDSDHKTSEYEEDEGSSSDTEEDHKKEESNEPPDNKTSDSKEDEGRSSDTEEDHDTEESNEPPDNVIYPHDIVKCDTLSTHKTNVKEEIVKCHNHFRSNVTPSAGNMLKLKWSNKLMESAERWAKTCTLNHSEVKDRNDNGVPYGENILISPACVKWTLIINQWHNERAYLIWGVGPIGNNVTGHYTQLVTYRTSEVGCAVNKCNVNGTYHVFFVCQYYPAGNWLSSLYQPYTKGKPCSLCRTDCDESGKLCLNSCSDTDKAGNCLAVKGVEQCEKFKNMCKATCLCKNKIT